MHERSFAQPAQQNAPMQLLQADALRAQGSDGDAASALNAFCREVLRQVGEMAKQSMEVAFKTRSKTKAQNFLLRFNGSLANAVAPLLTRESFNQCFFGDNWRVAMELEEFGPETAASCRSSGE